MRRRTLLKAGVALPAALLAARAHACEYFAATLRILHPWTRASGSSTTAVVSMKLDEVTQTDRLIGAQTPVAAHAELVGDLLVPQGGELVLSEDGPHVRLLDLQQPLLIGRVYPLDLVFEKAGKVGASLNVDFLRALIR